MRTIRLSRAAAMLLVACAVAVARPAPAQIEPTAQVLVPYFAVDLADPRGGDDTLFAVCNGGGQTANVTFTVYSNWGIPVLQVQHTMAADAVTSVNLRDWLGYGKLLDGKVLSAAALARLQAQLQGLPADDHLYYGTAVADHLAVGYVTIGTTGTAASGSLWGDFFTIKLKDAVFQGDTLVNIDPRSTWNLPCSHLGVRFLEGGPFKDGTHLIFWSPKHGVPSPEPSMPSWASLGVTMEVYDESGTHVEDRQLSLLPSQVVELHEMSQPLTPPFGWLEIKLDVDGFVGVDYNVHDAISAGLHAYCLPAEVSPTAAVQLRKLVNGDDADVAPGPIVPIGSSLVWTYDVTNVGTEPLTGIALTDEGHAIACPATTLEAGASFVCTTTGTAAACQQHDLAVVTASAGGGSVQDANGAYYYGQTHPALAIESVTANGSPAGSLPGPQVDEGASIAWAFHLHNVGDVDVSGLAVTFGGGAASCAKTTLAKGEVVACTAGGTAVYGQQSLPIAAQADGPCAGDRAIANANAYVTVVRKPRGISIVKKTNGELGDVGTGPVLVVGSPVTWTYLVTNTGQVVLGNVRVADDQHVAVSCPKSTLQPAESMTCTASGLAIAGQYRNTGTATGTPPTGDDVQASDTSQYYGVMPAIQLKKLVNGDDADSPPGPSLVAGTPALYTFVVTNVGDLALSAIVVADDSGLAVSCPKTTLAPSEAMTCTATAVAAIGAHHDVGTVHATWTSNGSTGPVSASDPANYLGVPPPAAITIEKLVNGATADTSAEAVVVLKGSNLLFTYFVTNSGGSVLSPVTVTDDQQLAVTCPKTVLQPGESMTCTANTTAATGLHGNIGTATGAPAGGGANVVATDPAWYFGAKPGIQLEKKANGEDADQAPGPSVRIGHTVTFTYVVTNSGNVTLTGITVTDDQGLVPACPGTTLEPGASMTCTASTLAKAKCTSHKNIGTATGTPPVGPSVQATDVAWYTSVQ